MISFWAFSRGAWASSRQGGSGAASSSSSSPSAGSGPGSAASASRQAAASGRPEVSRSANSCRPLRAPGRRCRRRRGRRDSWVFLDLELIHIGKGSPMDRATLWDQRHCAAVANRAARTGAAWKQRRGVRLPSTSALGIQWRRPNRQGAIGHAQHTWRQQEPSQHAGRQIGHDAEDKARPNNHSKTPH